MVAGLTECLAVLWLYRIVFPLALLLALPAYLRRAWRRGGLREKFSERLGEHPKQLRVSRNGALIWLQAVSVGEVLAIAPFLEELHRVGILVYLTTTTRTGYAIAAERYAPWVVGVGYFPVDVWPVSARAWRRIDPDMVILMEGERWPEHLQQAKRRGVPVIAINARISDRSFRRLSRFRPAARLMLAGVDRWLCGSSHDAARLRELGVSESAILTTGNLKFDVAIPRLRDPQRDALRRELGLPEGLVLLGSSTWPGEEAAMLEMLKATRARGLVSSLLLVPRHVERRGDIERLLLKSGLRFHFRSNGPAVGAVDVSVADTTGELRRLTQLADLVFVGKSLPPHTEGQTPLEAAALGRVLVLGPGMSNFRVIARELVEAGAAVQVESAEQLVAIAATLLSDLGRREQLVLAAAAWHQRNAGAVARTLTIVKAELAPRSIG